MYWKGKVGYWVKNRRYKKGDLSNTDLLNLQQVKKSAKHFLSQYCKFLPKKLYIWNTDQMRICVRISKQVTVPNLKNAEECWAVTMYSLFNEVWGTSQRNFKSDSLKQFIGECLHSVLEEV